MRSIELNVKPRVNKQRHYENLMRKNAGANTYQGTSALDLATTLGVGSHSGAWPVPASVSSTLLIIVLWSSTIQEPVLGDVWYLIWVDN